MNNLLRIFQSCAAGLNWSLCLILGLMFDPPGLPYEWMKLISGYMGGGGRQKQTNQKKKKQSRHLQIAPEITIEL